MLVVVAEVAVAAVIAAVADGTVAVAILAVHHLYMAVVVSIASPVIDAVVAGGIAVLVVDIVAVVETGIAVLAVTVVEFFDHLDIAHQTDIDSLVFLDIVCLDTTGRVDRIDIFGPHIANRTVDNFYRDKYLVGL